MSNMDKQSVMNMYLLFVVMAHLTCVTYNCTGLLQDRQEYIKVTLLANKVDLLLLQETWLHQNELSELSSMSDEYLSCGVSGFSGKDILRGRPYGGVGILWHKSS